MYLRMGLNILIWYWLIIAASLISVTRFVESSCPAGQIGGTGFSIKLNNKPGAIGSAEDINLQQVCDSDVCCSKHCIAHNKFCNVAVYDRVNKTCDLVCLTEKASFVKTTGITSLTILNQRAAYSIVDGWLLYPIIGGMAGGRILHISGKFLAEKNFDVNLWSSSKTNLLFHWVMWYHRGQSAYNTCTRDDDSLFPTRQQCNWSSQLTHPAVLLEVGSSFEIQLYAQSSSGIVIKVGGSYQQSYPGRYAGSLEDVTWLAVGTEEMAFDMNQLCIW